MLITDLVDQFKANKLKDKSEYASNVHKAYAKYLEIDPNADICSFAANVSIVYQYYVKKLSPCSVRNYLRWLKESSQKQPLVSLLNEGELSNFSLKVTLYLQEADKKANELKPTKNNTKEQEIDKIDVNSLIQEEDTHKQSSDNVDIDKIKSSYENSIEGLKTELTSKDNSIEGLKIELISKDNIIHCLKIENEGKNKEIKCLSNEIEFMRNLVMTLCKQHHT